MRIVWVFPMTELELLRVEEAHKDGFFTPGRHLAGWWKEGPLGTADKNAYWSPSSRGS